MADLSNSEARRLALAAQGFAEARPRGRVDVRHLRRAVARTGLLQIDTVNVLVRSHYLPLFSRLGPYPMALLDDAAYRRRELFEAWAHVASLVPAELYPLLRHRMTPEAAHQRFQAWAKANKRYVDDVLAQVREHGPLTAGELEDQGESRGVFWMRTEGKLAMEWLFRTGQVMVHSRPNFARSYDLTERVLPRAILKRTPLEAKAAERELLLLAARSHGVGTARDLADYYRIPVPRARALLGELTEAGALRKVSVEGWREPGYLEPGARAPQRIEAQALLTPFDPVVWERDRTERIFGFRYRIEIYLPEKEREYGYYVLPFLLGERLVGRVDLKADRAGGRLLARAAYVEQGEDAGTLAERLGAELGAMAAWLGLETVSVSRRGNLARALAKAVP